MEYWDESQGQPPLYAKFGTVPGRNYIHVYHDKYQAAGFQTYQPERQDRSREPNCWTVPGSRTGGVLQDYTNWTDPDLSPSASHFPFTLDNQTRHLQGLKEYQAHEKREREWVAEKAQRAVWDRDRERECERRTQKESWQRRWESCNPVHYRREIAKRSLSDSSYRELEAWAARYSHSLPRRRRMEAELLGTAQGSPESERVLERGSRSATEPRANEIHLPGSSRQTRELGHFERRDAQQLVNHRFSQSIVPETTYISDTKENEIKHPRKMFSAPPGYMPPPSYDTPHNISPVLPHPEKYNTEEIMAFGSPSWESRTHSPAYCSQTILKKQASVDSPNEKGGQEELTGPAWFSQQGPAAADLSWLNSPPQNTACNSPLEQELAQPPQGTYGHTEGRRLSLKKKRRGGETIFCLVSRMEGMEETSSFPKEPLSLPLLNPSPLVGIPSTELTEFSRNPGEFSDKNELQKLADEVDSSTPSLQLDSEVPAYPSSLKKESNLKLRNSDWMNSKQVAAHREELLKVIKNRTKIYECDRKSQSLSDQADKGTDLKENKHLHSSSSPMSERKSVQPLTSASVKYPLWREPNNVVRLESDSSPCSKDSWKGNESGIELSNDQRQKSDVGNPIDFEVKKLEIKKDKNSENSSGILVIDTTHVIVRVEFIFPPKKEHVQYLPQSSPPPGLDCASDTIQTDTQIKEETSELIINKPCHVPDNEKAKRESEQVDVREYVYQDQHSPFRVLVIETGEQKKSGETSHISNTTERNAVKNDTEKTSGFSQQDSDIQSQNEATSVLKSYTEDQTKEGVSLNDDCKGNDANAISEAIIREEVSKAASTEFDQAEDVVCVTDVIQKDTSDLCDQISTENKESREERTDREQSGTEQRERIYDTEMENHINIGPKVQEMTLQETVVTSEPSIESSHITSHEAQSQLDLETVPVLHLDSPPHSPEDSPCQSPPLSPTSQSHCLLHSIDLLSFPNQPLLSLVDSSSDPETLSADFSETTPSTHFQSALPIPSEPVSPSSSSFSLDICSNLQCPNILFPSTTGEEAQYPKSLWDAVNRIRKHTAPDSENEEEEVVEPWDPESMSEDSCCLETGMHLMKEKLVVSDGPKELVVFSSVGKITTFEEPGSSEVHSGDGVDFQKIKQHGKCMEGLFGPIIYDILDESLDNTPDECLDDTPDECLDNTPDESLDNTLDESLDNTPDESLDDTPDESLDNTLDESLDNTPDESLDDTPDESLDDTPDEFLIDTLDESLDETFDQSLDDTLSSSSTKSHGSGDTVIIGEEEDAEKIVSDTEKETVKEAEINKEGDIIHQDLSFTEVDGGSSLGMSTGKNNVKGDMEDRNETSKIEKPPNEGRETEERQESGEVKYHAEEDRTHTDQPTSEGDFESVRDLDLETLEGLNNE